jgi:hypothetical protein
MYIFILCDDEQKCTYDTACSRILSHKREREREESKVI